MDLSADLSAGKEVRKGRSWRDTATLLMEGSPGLLLPAAVISRIHSHGHPEPLARPAMRGTVGEGHQRLIFLFREYQLKIKDKV